MGAVDLSWADGLRRRYFPPERNLLPAHITLFHHLPPSVEAELRALLAELARTRRPEAWIEGAVLFDRGVAIAVRSPALLALRDRIAEHFTGLLIPQDQARPRFHITVQNKVRAVQARATLAELRDIVTPRPLVIAGLACWYYRGGPWEPIADYRFRG